MSEALDARLAQIRQRLDQRNHPSGLQDKLKKLKSRQAAQPSAPSQIPFSAQADTQIAGINRDRDFTNLSLNAQEQGLRQNYGFDDNSNPFSRAAQLQRDFQNRQRGTLNSYAAAGHLYSGSLNNARDIDRRNFEQAWDTESRNYQAQLAEIAQKRLEAEGEAQEGIVGAQAQALEDAIETRPDPATAPGKSKDKDHKKKGKK